MRYETRQIIRGHCFRSHRARITPTLAYSAAKTEEKPTTKAQEKQATAKKELIDIHTASEDELKSLEGIGDAVAKKTIANRPYKRKDDVVKQKIVSQTTIRQDSGSKGSPDYKDPGLPGKELLASG